MIRMRTNLLLLALVLPLSLLLTAEVCLAQDADGDGMSDEVETRLGLPGQVKQEWVPVATSPDAHFTDEQALVAAPDILSLDACHAGAQRVVLRLRFARPVDFSGATFIIYMDVDGDPKTGRVDQYHGGVDLMVVFSGSTMSYTFYGACNAKNTGARAATDGNTMYVAVDAPFVKTEGKLPLGVHLLSQRGKGASDSTRNVVVQLPVSTAEVPSLPLGKEGLTRSMSDYRYVNDKLAYEKLSDKGLRAAQVMPTKPIEFGRPRPEVPYSTTGRKPAQAGSIARRQVAVNLLEEADTGRSSSWLSFGFPLPQGGLYDPAQVRLLDGGAEVPAQIQATAFWPDGSLKWVLIDTQVALRAKEERNLQVEFGTQVRRAEVASPLKVAETADRLTVVTGPLQVAIDKQRFNLLSAVWSDANRDGVFSDAEKVNATGPEGLVLRDENGKVYTMAGAPPDSFKVELQGPQRVVVRVAGSYAAADGSKYLSYLARLTFRAGSSRVEVAITHLDDYLKTEFTDLTSLQFAMTPTGNLRDAAVYLEEGGLKPVQGLPVALKQWDESRSEVQAQAATMPGGRGAGVVSWRAGGSQGLAVMQDFWQRWPKGIEVRDGQVVFDLLPQQPSADYGKDLPYYLMFPFVDGRYRMKWGMAFTERLSFDFGGRMSPEELWAEVQKPVIAVLPADWYAETKGLGPLAAPRGKQFATWDKFVADSFVSFLQNQERTREYGFFNYGDWFGERGRNWGNNEYDLAHGLYLQFARTGNRDLCRWAQKSAQHRADVDTVNYYPDPYYVGATHQHSIGHSGTWTQTVEHATWSHAYDMHTSAEGGHVWADGIMDDWYLQGEPRAVESALALGEHIAWAFAPSFQALGTHERSAGWSLRAIMAIYRGTYDPVYLEAARQIAAVALREQKFDQGGAWPHVLPSDHAGDEPGAVGNNMFLMGILLAGLQAYHEECGDPAVLKSIESGAKWVAKSWNESLGGWPYSAKIDGTPLFRPGPGLNQLVIGGLSYVGTVTKDEKLMHIASEALAATCGQGAVPNGKGLAQQIFFTSTVLAELQDWYARTMPDKGLSVLDGSPESMAALLLRTATSDRHGARAPDKKVFYVQTTAPQAELTAERTPHGAMQKRAEVATVQLTDAAGKVLQQTTCSTDDKYRVAWPVAGPVGQVLQVLIDDDQRGVWTLKGTGLRIVTQTSADFRIGGVGRSRYYFLVPGATAEFRLNLVGVHTGPYAAAVVDPGNQVVATFQGTNPGTALIVGAAPGPGPAPKGNPEKGQVTVKPAAGQTGKIWSVILTAAGDIGVELVGVPPYLSLSPQDWFDPQGR